MNKTGKIIIGIAGTAVAVGVAVGGYYIGKAIEKPAPGVTELTTQVSEQKKIIDEQNKELVEARSRMLILEQQHSEDEAQLAAAEAAKAEALANKDKLQAIVDNNTKTIAENNRAITILNDRIAKAELNSELQANELAALRTQKVQLESANNNLQASNDSLLATIGVLNNQIVSYNNQIVALSAQVHNGTTMLATLNAQIKNLNTTIAFYRQYIESTVPEGKALATFEFDGSVFNLQVLNIGSTASVADPTSTEYVIFGGWQANDEDVVLEEYYIEQNTTFTAKVTYRYDVKYMVDGTQYGDSQIVTSGEYATLPTTAPSKPGYRFEGYTLDGVTLVDPSTTPITGHTTFIAKFTALSYEVKYSLGDNEQYGNTQFVLQNGFAIKPTNPIKPGYTFKGWAIGGTLVEPSTYPISQNTIFEAVWEKNVTVSYTDHGRLIKSVEIEKGTCLENFILSNTVTYADGKTSTKGGRFRGWSLDDNTLADLSTMPITEDTTLYCIFENKICGEYQGKATLKGQTAEVNVRLRVYRDLTIQLYVYGQNSGSPDDSSTWANIAYGEWNADEDTGDFYFVIEGTKVYISITYGNDDMVTIKNKASNAAIKLNVSRIGNADK